MGKIEKTESDIVLKVIHDNCDNKIQEVHKSNLDNLLLVGKTNTTSNFDGKHSKINASNSQYKQKSNNIPDKNKSQTKEEKNDYLKNSKDSNQNRIIQTTNVELI